MKKLLTLSLAFLMLFSVVLSGCGSSSEASIVGKWECELDFVDLATQGMDEDELAMIDVSVLKGTEFKMIAEFTKDGKLTMELDMDSLDAAANKMGDKILDAMRGYLEDVLEQNNIDMTVEEYVAALEQQTGKTLKENFLEGFDKNEIAEEASKEGKYELKGNKLYTSEGDEEMDYDEYEKVKITDDKLEFLGEYDKDDKETDTDGYPLVFKRIK